MSKGHIVFVETNSTGHGIRAIRTARKIGYQVTFMTMDPEFYRDGDEDALSEVDRLVITDTYSVSAMLNHVDRELTRGVVAFDDYHLLPASELASRLRVPHPDLEGLRNARFKDRLRLELASWGERRPKFAVLAMDDERNDSPVGYPCVVKPVDDSGSVGVRICRGREEYRWALQFLQTRGFNIRGYRPEKRWLVEEYVEGVEYSAEVLWVDGGWKILGVTKKMVTNPPYCVELGHVFPAWPGDVEQSFLEEKVLSWMRAAKMKWGAAHVEFKLTEDGPVLIEINPRLGGDLIPELCSLACGFDVVEYFLRISAGEKFCVRELLSRKPRKAYAIRFLCPDRNGGVVERVKGTDVLDRLAGVVDWRITAFPIEVHRLRSSYDRLGYVIAEGRDAVEAKSAAEEALSKLSLVWR